MFSDDADIGQISDDGNIIINIVILSLFCNYKSTSCNCSIKLTLLLYITLLSLTHSSLDDN